MTTNSKQQDIKKWESHVKFVVNVEMNHIKNEHTYIEHGTKSVVSSHFNVYSLHILHLFIQLSRTYLSVKQRR